MVARKWGLYVVPWSDGSSCHDSWAGFIVSRNSVGKFLASDLLQFVGLQRFIDDWVVGRSRVGEKSWSCPSRRRSQSLVHRAAAVVADSICLILSWVW
jgi:hypothetical protein